ncbi:TBC1 domain family member 4 isoform X2 [Rhipicephalus microplus]|uniref:TBC1 domain family member 4 isoform X2 n=1 Tax=Rhipicephalus microplus TaxID=6941 RepID=UPI003F6A67B7
MLDSTLLRKRFYKKLNIPGMERHGPPVVTAQENASERPTTLVGPLARNFCVKYLGSMCLDRRYTAPMLPWIVADLRREGLRKPVDVLLEVRDSSLKARSYHDERLVFDHPLQSISKFSHSNADRTCFTYLQRNAPDELPYCHVFQASDKDTVVELFMTVREVSKELSLHHGAGAPLARAGSCTDLGGASGVHQFEVLYVGKIKGSSKQSINNFLDDAVERARARQAVEASLQPATSEGPMVVSSAASAESVSSSLENIAEGNQADAREALLEDLRSCGGGNISGSGNNASLLAPPPHTLITHTHSLDTHSRQALCQELQNVATSATRGSSARVRSVSGDQPRPTKQTSLPTFRPRVSSGGAVDLRRLLQSDRRSNRTMLLLVMQRELRLLSTDRKQILVSRPFTDISRCYQGIKYADHFGFNCRDSTLSSTDKYIAYIFKCSSVQVANEIMQTLKQAFRSAHQSHVQKEGGSAVQSLCDSCPMHRFHKLCLDLEGLSPEDCCTTIQRYIHNLSDSDKQIIAARYQLNDCRTVQDKNELYMMLLRNLYEQKQNKHGHTQKSEGLLDLKTPSFVFDSFKEKAKKSITNSFDTILKLTLSDASPTGSREGSCDPTTPVRCSSPQQLRPRSSTVSTPETPKRSPLVNIFMKVGHTRRHSSSDEETTEAATEETSCRQSIFQRVNTPVRGSNHNGEYSGEPPSTPGIIVRRTREELRSLWRKAIQEQVLLIRMEKENRQLQASQDEVSSKRLRLDYEEVGGGPCDAETAERWDELLARPPGGRINPDTLRELVQAGVPRHRRGEIWLLLAEQYQLRSSPINEIDSSTTYEQLLNQLTTHQHAILIDLGRTFPSHPFYRDSLGAGQLSLYNLLKAYSLLDPQVGYCQGLSFVSGVLLLHMTEEQAFSMMKHLLFHLGLRRQYKQDMGALQVQLYQLCRLLYSRHRELYQHLDHFDIAPALYAAPWFLTLFASQFPLGFVSRLFDAIFLQGMEAVFKAALSLLSYFSDTLLSCNSFESIMECFKNTLPALDAPTMEGIVSGMFSLDLGQELVAYQVEYHLLQEEMVYTPKRPGVSSADLEENRTLRRQNMELLEQLQVANNNVSRLEASVSSYQGTVQHLEKRIRQLEDERDALHHSNAALRHRLDRLEAADERNVRSLSFGASGEAHDGIAQLVRRLGDQGPLPEDEEWCPPRADGCDGL